MGTPVPPTVLCRTPARVSRNVATPLSTDQSVDLAFCFPQAHPSRVTQFRRPWTDGWPLAEIMIADTWKEGTKRGCRESTFTHLGNKPSPQSAKKTRSEFVRRSLIGVGGLLQKMPGMREPSLVRLRG